MAVGGFNNSPPTTTNRTMLHAASVAAAAADILYVSDVTNGYCKPAGQFTDQGTEALTQQAFAAAFAGIGTTTQSASDTTARPAGVLIDQIVSAFPCDSSTYEQDDYVAPKYTAGVLSNQVLVKVTDPTRAIGQVVRKYTSAVTTVDVRFTSSTMMGMLNNALAKATVTAPPSSTVSSPGATLTRTGGNGCMTTTGTASAGGPGVVKGGVGGAATSGTAGAGGATTIGGAVGGAATTGTPGAGSTSTVVGGVGGAATAGTGNGGAGGSVVLAPAVGGATTGGTAGVDGGVFLRSTTGRIFKQQTAPSAGSDQAEVLTAAMMFNGIFVHTLATGRTLTTPTGAAISAACPADVATGDSFDFTVITIGTGADDICTLTAGDGNVTFVGVVTIGPNIAGTDTASATFRFRKTGASTWVGYRLT